jgi:hypothetical protein
MARQQKIIFWIMVYLTGLLLPGANIFAQDNIVETPFNVSEIIERVVHYPIIEGDKVVIKDFVYEAMFDENGIILKAKGTNSDVKEMFIPINGRLEIRDNKVVYYTENGEVIFEGKNSGLRFKERRLRTETPIIGECSGELARLKIDKINDWSREGEFLIDSTLVSSSAPGSQSIPAVAYGGGVYLVVWEDWRNGDENVEIYGARVNPGGTVLDPAGITISTANGNQTHPSVAFNGTNFLVAWEDYRNGSASYTDIYGARVTPGGTVLDPNGIAICTAGLHQFNVRIASDGSKYLVVWEDGRVGGSAYDIYGKLVTGDGNVLGEIAISTAQNGQTNPSVAYGGTNYLVVWEDNRTPPTQLYGARVSTDGTVLDPTGFVIRSSSSAPGAGFSPAVAYGNTNYLVVWFDTRNGGSYQYADIYGARVSTSGTVLDPNGIAICTASNPQRYPSIAFDGTNYLVEWLDERNNGNLDIYGARVTPDGTVLDPSGIAISTGSPQVYWASLTFGGGYYMVVWVDDRGGDTNLDIYGARVSPGGAVLDPSGILISKGTSTGKVPAVAFDGNNYLVVWADDRNLIGTNNIFGARVSSNGTVLDPTGIAIHTSLYDQTNPAVGFDGTNYLVVWQQDVTGQKSYDLYCARVSTDGTVLDPSGIAICTATDDQVNPSIAFDGTNYLVVWEDWRRIQNDPDIYGARVGTDGEVLDPNGFAISLELGQQTNPAVGFDGTNYLVVWSDYRASLTDGDLYGARVTPLAAVLDPSGFVISNAYSEQINASISFDGTNYLVVWEDYRQDPYIWPDIYGARITPGGTVLDPSGIAICAATNSQLSPGVAFDGTEYLVVWEDWRSGFADIYGARLNTSGTVIGTFPLSTQQGAQKTPALARGSGNKLLIVYSGFVDYINNNPVNANRIWGKIYPTVGIEENTRRAINDNQFLYIYPNPFRFTTRINYTLARQSHVLLRIYNVNGQLVKTLVNAKQNPGTYEMIWDGKNDLNVKVNSGVYILQIETDIGTLTRKMVFVD